MSRENSRLLVLTLCFSAAVSILALTLSLRETPRLAEVMAGTDIAYSGIVLDQPDPAGPASAQLFTAPEDASSDTIFLASDAGAFTGAEVVFEPAPVSDPPADPAPNPGLPDGYVDPDDDGFVPGPGLTISGRVTDPWGRGIAGVEIMPVPVSPWSSTWPSLYVTDAQGNYAVSVGSAGLYKIQFTAPHHAQREWYDNSASVENATVVPNGASGVDAVLMPAGSLHAHIQPGNSFTIAAYRAGTGDLASTGSNAASPTPYDVYFDGFTSLAPGDYKLYVIPELGQATEPFWYENAESFASAQTVTVKMGETTHVNISPPPPTGSSGLYGHIFIGHTNYNLESLGSADISVVDAHDESRVLGTQHTADYFNFPALPAGQYKLKATLPDGNVVWHAYGDYGSAFTFDEAVVMTVQSGMSLPVSFYIHAMTAYISGRVTTESGAPVAGHWMAIYNTGSDIPAMITSTWDHGSGSNAGNYLSMVMPGTYRVCVYSTDTTQELCTGPVTVGWRETLTGIDITVPDDFLPAEEYNNIPEPEIQPDYPTDMTLSPAADIPAQSNEDVNLPEEEQPEEAGGNTPPDPVDDVAEDSGMANADATDTEAAPTGGAPPGAQELSPVS